MKWALYFSMTILLFNGVLTLASAEANGTSYESGTIQLAVALVLFGIASVVDRLGERR